MSKKRKKKVINESFDSWMIDNTESDTLINITKSLKYKLEKFIITLNLSDKVISVDNIYSLTIRETDRNIRLVGTVLIYPEDEEQEKKMTFKTINLNTKLDKSTLIHDVEEIEAFKCLFYAYRNLVESINSMNCLEHIDLSSHLNK